MTEHRRLCIVTAAPLTVRAFLVDQIRALSREYHVTVATSIDPDEAAQFDAMGIHAVRVPIERRIAPLHDLRSVWMLWRLLRAERFDAVHSVTPKAGLVAMTAARAAGVPVRVHVFTGQVWATRTGLMRRLLKWGDRLLARQATTVVVDSASQRDFLLEEGVLAGIDARVLGDGSISGVDPARFRPDAVTSHAVREELRIPQGAPLILFLGRLNMDKGVLDLAKAFESLAGDAHLLFVGPDEGGLRSSIEERCRASRARLRFVGSTERPERFMAAADVLALPSYREGFGSVVLEAAACGVPAVASRIYGLTDAVVDGVTGLLHRPGDPVDLRAKLDRLLADAAERVQMGTAAQARALERFDQRRLTEAVTDLHAELRGTRVGRREASLPAALSALVRRSLEIVGSAVALIVLAPLMVWIAMRVRHDLGAPILFRQVRAGRWGRPFTILKFRTMREATGSDGEPLEDAVRLTPFGAWLRSTSLDELPELWNVLRGDMSLVGPRPLPVAYLERYTPEQARRHAVRPGLTGWAQVNGRNALGWRERFALDVWYVDHRTWALDLRILALTLRQVWTREGINAPGHATMAPFTGGEES